MNSMKNQCEDYGTVPMDLPIGEHRKSSSLSFIRRKITLGIFALFGLGATLYTYYPTTRKWQTNLKQHVSPPVTNDPNHPLISQCKELWLDQLLDQFSFEDKRTYKQRYFVCDKYWIQNNRNRHKGPIFFYLGNEANVELYLNHTGLMWESAAEFGALLVFAEHRYFGKSLPFGKNSSKNMQYLSAQQALADYASLITFIKTETDANSSPVIGFGGSYGGMLGSWFRLKYPHIIDGVVAGSAPVLSFLGENPPYDPFGFGKVVTRDASVEGGSNKYCAKNIRQVWDDIFDFGKTKDGRTKLQSLLRLCDPVGSEEDALAIAFWAQSAFDYMAMGNYPYPSSYIMNGDSVLPAYPVREACTYMDGERNSPYERLSGLSGAVGVYYNSTGKNQCFKLVEPNAESKRDSDYWSYLYCTELFQPMARDGVQDMFWPQPLNLTDEDERCKEEWGVTPRKQWGNIYFGGHKAVSSLTNIIFTNGDLDPWSAYGVDEECSSTVICITIEGGAHHLGLMFSNKLDPPSVIEARETIREHMHRWVDSSYTDFI